MRNRTRGAFASLEFLSSSGGLLHEAMITYVNGEKHVDVRTSPWSYGFYTAVSDLESISDEGHGWGGFNPCSHLRHYSLDIDATLPSLVHSGVGGWYEWAPVGHTLGAVKGKYYPLARFDVPTDGDLAPIDWPLLVEKVGASLDGSLSASSNMLVNLAELGQTLGMLKNPFGLLSTKWRRTLKSVRQATKLASSVWLEKRYGWDNFIRDMDAIIQCYEEASQHLAYLEQTKGKHVSVSERSSDTGSYSAPMSMIGYEPNGFTLRCSNPVLRRTACFSLDLLRGPGFVPLSRMRYAMQRLGVTSIVDALWDVLPYSFVVDWFIDIQTYLKGRSIDPNAYNLRNVGYSVSHEYFLDVTLTSSAYAEAEHSDYQKVWRSYRVAKSYSRTPGFPAGGTSVGIFGGLNLTHLADLSALIAQRVL